LLQLRIR